MTAELTPAEANRRFYAEHAEAYDAEEFCANASAPQRRLHTTLDHALEHLGPDAAILDAGGGSGNASAYMTSRGFDPLVVDISPEMTDVWRRKAIARGIDPRIEIAPLEDFFARDERSWDLIVFSSVLHHLDDPIAVLEAAARRLEPGGFIATVFDPLAVGRRGVAMRRLDYLTWLLLHSPREAIRLISNRVRPSRPEGEEANVGAVAELHAWTGLDDAQIIDALNARGLAVVAHERIPDARYGYVRAAARAMRMATNFSLVVRATEAGPAGR